MNVTPYRRSLLERGLQSPFSQRGIKRRNSHQTTACQQLKDAGLLKWTKDGFVTTEAGAKAIGVVIDPIPSLDEVLNAEIAS